MSRVVAPAVSEDRLELEAYLHRIGVGTPPSPDLAGLEVLHEAHCAAIPFENLDILLGRPIALDLTSLQAKLVAGRRGGYCFEQNTLFAAVLEVLAAEFDLVFTAGTRFAKPDFG